MTPQDKDNDTKHHNEQDPDRISLPGGEASSKSIKGNDDEQAHHGDDPEPDRISLPGGE